MKLKIEKKDVNKYVIIDENNMLVSCEYIPTLKQAKQEIKDLREFFKL